jgi:outer membrane lipoprotein SlyB
LVGTNVGTLVGTFVGTLVGTFVGTLVGTFVGAVVAPFTPESITIKLARRNRILNISGINK